MGSDMKARPDVGTVKGAAVMRGFGWINITVLAALLINNAFVLTGDFAGPLDLAKDPVRGLPLLVLLVIAIVVAWLVVSRSPAKSLRADALRISAGNAFLIRGCFFAVLFVGLADATIAFLRVENLLGLFLVEDQVKALARSHFVGQYIHIPLIIVGFIAAIFARGLGFTWLAFLIVLVELGIVISRFLFSYEQALMGDLVRYWYAALFLFASAHTLFEDAHVRVDVLYAGFHTRKKGAVNGIGTLLLGLSTCWVIIVIGFGHARAIINAPMANFEISQTGSAGMFTKYQMAAFLAVFAITMLIQLIAYLFEAYADYRGEPGKRETAPSAH